MLFTQKDLAKHKKLYKIYSQEKSHKKVAFKKRNPKMKENMVSYRRDSITGGVPVPPSSSPSALHAPKVIELFEFFRI